MSGLVQYLFNENGDRLVAKLRRNVSTVETGVVVEAGFENPDNPKQCFGFRIKVRSLDGERTWIYAHMDQTAPVFDGLLVSKGSIIGRYADPSNGNTTGPHLHLEVRDRQNQAILDQGGADPIPGGRMTSGINPSRTLQTNNGLQVRPHNGTDWVAR